MERRIPCNDTAGALRAAMAQGHAGPEHTSLVLYDLDRLRARALEAVEAFPPGTLHAVAVKANPLASVLSFIRGLHPDLGAEVASLPELHMALAAGFEPRRILFDSPAKTGEEIALALAVGAHLNVDNFQELERVAELVRTRGAVKSSVGLRVNPQVGAGAIPSTSVAAGVHKLGVPVGECRAQILAALEKYPWLTALHSHVGSQGCSLDQLTAGARVLADLAREAGGRVRTLDIGGGLPATYAAGDPKPTLGDYARALREACPGFWAGEFALCTEFGRAVHAGAGFAASRVEYVKPHGGMPMAVIHLGADMFLRECYNPGDWRHEVLALDASGRIKEGPAIAQRVAGPLCFQGDFPAREAPMPALEQGDWVLVRDAGAYTLSMWSRYNSRQMPQVLGFERRDGGYAFTVLRKRESVEDVLRFWS
ncbi:type III PLP-dependent enzyme domain-containing protein [Desulfocurvus sp. DL9XJH121]